MKLYTRITGNLKMKNLSIPDNNGIVFPQFGEF